jgi:endonuclease G, mitochondrial
LLYHALRISTLATLLLAITPAQAQFSRCPEFFPNVTPILPAQMPAQRRELCFDAFAVLHSGQSKTPLYTAERLTREQLQDAADEPRSNRFYAEARLPSADRADLSDYQGSGYDRGHMAPAADMPTAQAMAQSFSLSNMVPQAPTNNRGAWSNIEKSTRKYVQRASGPVYVFTGPVFQGKTYTVGPGQVWRPSHLYKLVYDPQKGRAWAHWIENTDEARPSRTIRYEELVRRTGIEFLPGISVQD